VPFLVPLLEVKEGVESYQGQKEVGGGQYPFQGHKGGSKEEL